MIRSIYGQSIKQGQIINGDTVRADMLVTVDVRIEWAGDKYPTEASQTIA